jgi:hypothetical protein
MLQMCLYFECLLVVEPAEPRRGADLSGCAASEPVRNLLCQPGLTHSVIQIPTQFQMKSKPLTSLNLASKNMITAKSPACLIALPQHDEKHSRMRYRKRRIAIIIIIIMPPPQLSPVSLSPANALVHSPHRPIFY